MDTTTAIVITNVAVIAFAAWWLWLAYRHRRPTLVYRRRRPTITDREFREFVRRFAAIHAVHQRAMARRDNQPDE